MSRASAENTRRVLCVFSRYPDGFGIPHAHRFFPKVSSFMVPQGILTVAAYLPPSWEVRVIDENVRPLGDDDLRWADVVMASGTHAQRKFLLQIAARARAFGKVSVVGGPSVSACVEYYPAFDILHVGELGDGTVKLIAHLDRTVERPERQVVFTTTDRIALDDYPLPAYDKIDFFNYYTATVQWSSGCPYTCDFCDIPALYGRNPRYKSPERLVAELDAIVARNPVAGIYFVDDNLIGNKKAFRQLLPHVIAWQKRTGYRARLAGECTLNLATDREILALMREACFTDIFFGIESPDEDTLKAIDKEQNVRMPLLEAVRVINSYGIELSAGMIFGLDGDGPDAADKILRFIDASNIPFVAPNLLTALPKTPLWERLEKEGRLVPSAPFEDGELNVVYQLGQEAVLGQWRKVIEHAFRPEMLYRRFLHQIEHTYPNRKPLSLGRYPLSRQVLGHVSYALFTTFTQLGIAWPHRREFWRMALPLLRRGDVGQVVFLATMGHHFIGYGADALSTSFRANIYGPRVPEAAGRLATGKPRKSLPIIAPVAGRLLASPAG